MISHSTRVAGAWNARDGGAAEVEVRGLDAARWQDLDSLSGAEVRVTQSAGSVEGRSLGADRDGALLVEVGGRVERYYAGDVSLRAAQGQAS